MRRKIKALFMVLSMCCMLLTNFTYVMAANPENTSSKMEKNSMEKFIMRRESY